MTMMPMQEDGGGPLRPVPRTEQAPAIDSQQLERLMLEPKSVMDAAMDLRGSRQVAPRGSLMGAIAGLESGHYEGLESLDFGKLPDGSAAAAFTDENGQRQVLRITPAQMMAGLQTRAQARAELARRIGIQRQAERLMPAMAPMVAEVEREVPGFSTYAEMGVSEDPMKAFEVVERIYTGMKERDQQAIQQAVKVADQATLMQSRQRAETFAEYQRNSLAEAARGFIEDESIPEDLRAARVQDVKRQQYEVDRFALLAPPVGSAARNASMPTYYMSQGNPEPVRELARATIRAIGPDAIRSLGNRGLPFAAQKAQQVASQIGWNRPFNEADIDMVTAAIEAELMQAQGVSPQMIQQAGQRAIMSDARQAQDQRGYEREMRQADLEGTRSRIANERARVDIAAEEARIKRSGMTAEAFIERADPQVRAALKARGVTLDNIGLIPALTKAIREAKASDTPAAKERLKALQEAVMEIRRVTEMMGD